MANRQLIVNGMLRTVKDGRDVQTAVDRLRFIGRTVLIPKGKPPQTATMEKWVYNGVAKATDGCSVEPDGDCPHGHPSWLKVMGII